MGTEINVRRKGASVVMTFIRGVKGDDMAWLELSALEAVQLAGGLVDSAASIMVEESVKRMESKAEEEL